MQNMNGQTAEFDLEATVDAILLVDKLKREWAMRMTMTGFEVLLMIGRRFEAEIKAHVRGEA